MQRAGRDDRGVPVGDELREKVMRLLAVYQTGERAVLAFDEHAGEDQDVGEKPGLPLGESKPHEPADPRGTHALSEANRDRVHHRKRSATCGSNPRPPLRPLPPYA
jgi:hypothetical protein